MAKISNFSFIFIYKIEIFPTQSLSDKNAFHFLFFPNKNSPILYDT